jgi:hypothetical protein
LRERAENRHAFGGRGRGERFVECGERQSLVDRQREIGGVVTG